MVDAAAYLTTWLNTPFLVPPVAVHSDHSSSCAPKFRRLAWPLGDVKQQAKAARRSGQAGEQALNIVKENRRRAKRHASNGAGVGYVFTGLRLYLIC